MTLAWGRPDPTGGMAMTFTWEKVADWFVNPTFYSVGLSLLIFALTLGMLERLFRARGRQHHGPRSVLLDLCFWFFTPLVTKALTTSLLIVLVAAVLGVSAETLVQAQASRPSLLGRQPLWLQVV